MTTAVWGFIGVVVGGLLTVTGQATAEWIKAKFARQEREDRRHQLAREFQREATVGLQRSMADYKAALIAYRSAPRSDTAANSAFARARAEFQILVHRVDDGPTRDAAHRWEDEALAWYLDDDHGTAAREDTAWARVMQLSGKAIRDTT